METPNLPAIRALRPAWNEGRIVGQKRPLKPKHVWAIRVRLELTENHRDFALFNMAIDSKLRGCDLVKTKVVDVMASGQIKERASVLQSKTQKPVRFEISEGTRASVEKWMEDELMIGSEYLWPGRFHERLHISTRQYPFERCRAARQSRPSLQAQNQKRDELGVRGRSRRNLNGC